MLPVRKKVFAVDEELERLIEESDPETLEEALRIAKLHWAIDFQRRDYGFDKALEKKWLAFIMAEK